MTNEQRKEAVRAYRWEANEISTILDSHDPIGISHEEYNEYDPEAESIVLRLADSPAIDSVAAVQMIIHEEFVV